MKKKKSKSMDCAPMVDRKWEVESAARALIEAEKIRGDSKLYASAKAELKRMSEQARKAAK